MDLSTSNEYASAMTMRLGEAELRRLTQTERDLEGRLASAQGVLREAASVRQGLLVDAATVRNKWAIRAAEDHVRSAEGVVRKLERALAALRHERDGVRHRLGAAEDRARRLDESASTALVMCELVDALKAFETASERLAAALEGSHGRATHSAPFVAASLRITKTSVAAETRAVVSEIEAYRAGLADGSVKPRDPARLEDSGVGRELTRAHAFVGVEPAISIIPSPDPPSPVVSEAEPKVP